MDAATRRWHGVRANRILFMRFERNPAQRPWHRRAKLLQRISRTILEKRPFHAAAFNTNWGFSAATRSNTRAAPLGVRVPCSQW